MRKGRLGVWRSACSAGKLAGGRPGEQVAAAIVLRPNQQATDVQLIEFLQERIARHKVPKFWFFTGSLPVNASGKIQKFVLRDQYATPPPP